MTIKSILKSKACDGNKNDKKCAKALNKYIKKKYKHKSIKHKGGGSANASAGSPRVINKINFNQPASVAQAPAVVSTAIPQPRATGQGIPADVPYKNLMNQREVYETKLKNAQKENERLLALSKLNSSSTGSSTMNDASTMTDTGKSGRPKGSKNKPKEVIPMADSVGTGESFNEGNKDKDYLQGMSESRRGVGRLRGFGGGGGSANASDSANASAGQADDTQDPSTKKPRKKRCPNGERRNSLTGLCEKIL